MIQNFYRGDTKKYKLTITSQATGEPISVDGGVLFFTLKQNRADPDEDAFIQKTVNCTEIDPTDPAGEIEIMLTNSETDITPSTYYYDFQFVSESGEVITIISDEVQVLTDITRSTS